MLHTDYIPAVPELQQDISTDISNKPEFLLLVNLILRLSHTLRVSVK